MSTFHTLRIKSLIRQTDKAVQICFDVPDNLKSTFDFEPGQYLNLSTSIDGEEVRRSYSICSTPDEDLSVAVKAIPDGLFSNFVNESLKAGDTLEVSPALGDFTIKDQNASSHYCAFVAGSGITPVMSLLKSVLQSNDSSKFVLVYGNKSPEETIFLKELSSLQKTYPDRIFIEKVYSQTRTEDARFGRIEKPIINYILKNKYKSETFREYFICGPEPMIEHVQAVLKENNIDEAAIKLELFYSEKDGETIEQADGQTRLKVIVDDEEHDLVMDKESVILNAILDKDIDVPYSCQGGICSSCLAQIKTGQAKMRKNQILTDEEVEQGLILTCQAQPTTAEVTVDYDDI